MTPADPTPPGHPPVPAPPRPRGNPPSKWLVGGLLLVIAVPVGWSAWSTFREYGPRPRPTAYYTVDDGATTFVDSVFRVPPFDRGGRPAVRAQQYSCDGGRTQFVAYLQKLPEPAVQKLIESGRDMALVDAAGVAETVGWLAKRPGDAAWVSSKDDPAAYERVTAVTCPDGRGTPVRCAPPPD